jgi:predicted MFS family arabinose efflux permease
MRRAFRMVFGEVDRRILPILPVTLIYAASFSTFWVYVGVYAVKGLGWHAGEVGVLFLASAPPAAVANYLSGRLADRVGRRLPIVWSFLAASAITASLAAFGDRKALAFALVVALGVVGAPAYSLDRVLVADLVPEEEAREAGYATLRVAGNLGVFAGPPLAALLIAAGGWTAFLAAITALGLAGAAAALALLPRDAVPAGAGRPPGGALRLVVRDRPFVLLLVSTLLGFFVYCGFETVLPVIAVSTYGLSPATWGLLVAISPLLVVLLQLRLTRAASGIPAGRRLAGALLLMGLPFLALTGASSVGAIAAVIVVFVLGEMLWTPTTQAVAAGLAPPPVRGTYFGALAATTGPAWTLAPFLALELRTHAGVAAVWVLFAVLAAAGAAAGLAAARSHAPLSRTCQPPRSRAAARR